MKVKINPKIIRNTRLHYNIPLDIIAKKLKITTSELEEWERNGTEVSFSTAKEFAGIFKKHWTIFLLEDLKIEEPSLKDFRNLSKKETELSKHMHFAIENAEKILELAEEISGHKLSKEIYNKIFRRDKLDEISIFVRTLLKISISEQKKWSSPYIAYKKWMSALEGQGLYIAEIDFPMEEAQAFSLIKDERAVIVINRHAKIHAKIFSLFHELTHVLMKKAGICDFHQNNSIEATCNKVAANFLLPEESLIHDISTYDNLSLDELLTRISNLYKISTLVTLIKFKEVGYIDEEEFKLKYKEIIGLYRKNEKKQKNIKLPKIFHINKAIKRNSQLLTNELVNFYHEENISYKELSSYLKVKVKDLPLIINAIGADG